MLTLTNHFSSTYKKLLLDDWKTPRDLIRQKTLWVKNAMQWNSAEKPLSLEVLSDQQINDAQNGPFQQFFQPLLSAYALIAKIETVITIHKEDFFKEAEHVADKTLGVSQATIDKIDIATLKEIRMRLDIVAKTCFEQWETNIHTWTDTIIAEMKKNDIALSDMELNDFMINHPVSELHDIYVNLKVPAPKLPKTNFDFSQYFTAKASIAIYSAFCRTQQPHTEKDIEHKIKSMRGTFQLIEKTEKDLSEIQKKTIAQTVASITKN